MNRKQFARGLRTGIPISLGYLAVSFTMGITAKNAGLSAFQATLTSLLVNASAGQYAAFTMMAANSGFLELAIMEAVTNARYILISARHLLLSRGVISSFFIFKPFRYLSIMNLPLNLQIFYCYFGKNS